MIQVLGVLMGVDMEMRSPEDAAGAGGPSGSDARFEPQEDVEMPDAAGRPTTARTAKKAPEPEPVVEELDEEALEKQKAKAAADEEKALGTASYKKRDFDAAIKHYQAAWDLHKDITYLNNLGAANFEKGDYQGCIDACTKAVEEGRSLYADFKMIAKSYARIGSAYEKLGDLEKAIEHYNMSLREHRTPDVVNKVRAAERNKIETARKAYIDPAKAEEAREEGNKKFKESDWPGAVAAYSEMIKRAPEDPGATATGRRPSSSSSSSPARLRTAMPPSRRMPSSSARTSARPRRTLACASTANPRRVRGSRQGRQRAPCWCQRPRDRAAAAEGILGHVLGPRERDGGADQGAIDARS